MSYIKYFKLIQIPIVFLLFDCSQKKKTETDFADKNVSKKNDTVVLKTAAPRKRLLSIQNTYPYNVCDKIELISYESRSRLLNIHKNELIKDGKFVVPDIHQILTLKGAQKDSVLSMLIRITETTDSSSNADCYDPHQAIVFYKQKRAIEFIEFCFSCQKNIQSSGFEFGGLSDDEFCLVGELFIKNKIDYGINFDEFYFYCKKE